MIALLALLLLSAIDIRPQLFVAHVRKLVHALALDEMLVLAATVLALSTLPGRAGPCAQDIDRAWAQVDVKIHARIAAGRSAPQNVIGLLHHQPTLSSIAAAEKTPWPGVDASGGRGRRTGEGARSRPSGRQKRLRSDPCTGATCNRTDSLNVSALAVMGLPDAGIKSFGRKMQMS